MLTREQAEAIYDEGKDAAVALVLELSQQVLVLAGRVKELEERLGKNSRNSHKPPSSDGLRRRTVSSRESSGKGSGGQPGHPGTTLKTTETPDRVEEHPPKVCPGCQASLEGVAGTPSGRRQVIDLARKLCETIEHQTLEVECPHCHTKVAGEFPAGVTQAVQYGQGVKSLGVYLQEYQLLPYERTQEFFKDMLEIELSEGTLDRGRERCAADLEPVEAAIKAAITTAEVAGFDETGVRVTGKTQWLHTASTEQLTYYEVHAKRGTVAMEAIGILPNFQGTAVHDCLAAYFKFASRHGVCNAHLLRELKAVATDPRQAWAQEMRDLLRTIKKQVDQARESGAVALDALLLAEFARQYHDLITAGLAANPPPEPTGRPGRPKQTTAKNLLDRMDKHRDCVLLFMRDFRVPFDNNLSERDLRMAKVKQKVSGCFRSPEGAKAFCRIRGYISTIRKQDLPVLDALRSVFAGSPILPELD